MPKNLQLQYGCILEKDYPAPTVDIAFAMREARLKISAARRKQGTQDETQAVIKKHASRKGMQGSKRDKNSQIISSNRLQKESRLLNVNTKQQKLF